VQGKTAVEDINSRTQMDIPHVGSAIALFGVNVLVRGPRVDIKLAKAGARDTTATQSTQTQNRRTERKKEALLDLADALRERLEDRNKSLSSASRHLQAQAPGL
jgi:hypothetical protein